MQAKFDHVISVCCRIHLKLFYSKEIQRPAESEFVKLVHEMFTQDVSV